MPHQSPVPAAALDDFARAQILAELVETAVAQATAQLDGLITRLAEALLDTCEAGADPALAKLHAAAATLLRKNRYPFSYVTAERLRAMLQHELQTAMRGVENAREAGGALKSLAPDVEVDKTISLGKAARTLDKVHAERLAALEQRLASLFGRAGLEPARHPFRPQVFLDALHEAWCEFHPDTAAHALVFPLLGPRVGLDLAPILHALNQVLVKRGILPQLPRPVAAALRPPPEEPADLLTQRLQQWFAASGDGAFVEEDLPALLEPHALGRTRLVAYLDSLRQNLFDEHLAACGAEGPRSPSLLIHVQQHAPPDSMSPVDRKIVELLVAVFETVLREQAIDPEMKAMIASLQLPMLRAALADRAFFLRADQPARRTIELLAGLGIDWDRDKGQTDPVYLTVKRNVERVRRGAEERPDVFLDAVWDLEAFMRREQTAADQILAAPIAAALKEEKSRQAEKQARHEVALRVGTGEVVAFVEAFLEDKWVTVLTLAYEQDDRPEQAREALQTMDDLVWSVKPKITAAERAQLLALLPGMVAKLNKWLDRVQWSGAERTRFFSELADCHASLVRAPLKLSPQRQVELALEAAQQAAERRLRRHWSQLPELEPDVFDHRVQGLQHGAWLEFAEPGGLRRLKLAWISPMRSLYVFAVRGRGHALSLTDEALAAALREGRARIVETNGLVHRVLCERLGVPVNDAQRPAA